MVTKFPFHNACHPSFSIIFHATFGTSRNRNSAVVTWYMIFIRSMGATTDLAIMPATPPQRRLRTSLGRLWMARDVDSFMICLWSRKLLFGYSQNARRPQLCSNSHTSKLKKPNEAVVWFGASNSSTVLPNARASLAFAGSLCKSVDDGKKGGRFEKIGGKNWAVKGLWKGNSRQSYGLFCIHVAHFTLARRELNLAQQSTRELINQQPSSFNPTTNNLQQSPSSQVQ